MSRVWIIYISKYWEIKFLWNRTMDKQKAAGIFVLWQLDGKSGVQ